MVIYISFGAFPVADLGRVTFAEASPVQIFLTILLIICGVLFVLAWMVAFWIWTTSISDARASGHRYWMGNPRAILASYRARNWNLYLAVTLAMIGISVIVVGILIFTGRI